MSATDQPIPTTVGNTPVPASYDGAQNKWLPNSGTGGAPDVRVVNLPAIQPVSAADGSQVTMGAKTDAAATDDTGTWSLLALVKRLLQKWTAGLDVTDRAARLMGHVTVDSSAVTTNTLQNAVAAVGAGTPMAVSGLTTAVITLSGTFVATVTFEVTTVANNPQASDWFPINVNQVGVLSPSSTATTAGVYRLAVAGLAWVRARVSAYTSGNVTANGAAIAAEDSSKQYSLARRETVTIQTHNAVSVALSGFNSSSIIDCRGAGEIAVGYRSDASHTGSLLIDWFVDNAGNTRIGQEPLISSAARVDASGRTTVKAPWAKITIVNGDAALAHVMSTWTTFIP